MQKTRIEWVRNPDGSQGYSWNPIKGICPVGCWYCYGRRMYQRFKLDPKPWLDIAELNQAAETRLTGKRIFVCSTFELFHPIVDSLTGRCVRVDEMGRKESHDKARDMIFDVIKRRPDLTFIVLTKMPERIDRPMPDNVWLGVSVTGGSLADTRRTEFLARIKAKIKFISFEPILFPPWLVSLPLTPDWVIAGRLTGHGKIHDPARGIIKEIVEYAQINEIPIFLKNNLKEIWGEPLIQEIPSLKVSEED